ncbi:MAG: hypothetical protein U0P45_12980 [Acidimicrobiales bacterium]
MRYLRHAWALLADALRYSVHHRSVALVAVLVLGVVAVGVALFLQLAAPAALYPFL